MYFERFEVALFGLVLAFVSNKALAGESQFDDLIKSMQPLSAINSKSQSADYRVYPEMPQPRATGRPIYIYPTLEGQPPEQEGMPSRYGLDQGLPVNVFSMFIGENRAAVELYLIDRQKIDEVLQIHAANPNHPPALYSAPLSMEKTAEDAFEARIQWHLTPIDPYSLKPRHNLSAKTLQRIDELHQLPFRTIFSIYVERDTGQVVCRVKILGRNKTFSLIQKGSSFEAALSAGVVRMYRDRLVFLAEDLARNDFEGFKRVFLNSVGSRMGNPSFWSHVNGAGYASQLFRSRHRQGKMTIGQKVAEIEAMTRFFPNVTVEEAAIFPLPKTSEFDENSDL